MASCASFHPQDAENISFFIVGKNHIVGFWFFFCTTREKQTQHCVNRDSPLFLVCETQILTWTSWSSLRDFILDVRSFSVWNYKCFSFSFCWIGYFDQTALCSRNGQNLHQWYIIFNFDSMLTMITVHFATTSLYLIYFLYVIYEGNNKL